MKHVIIVGGSKGLGRELAQQYAREGVTVSVFSRTINEPAEPNVCHYAVDLADEEARRTTLAQAVENNGRLDSLIFCQRYRGQDDPWTGELEVGLTATKDLMEKAVEHFSATGPCSMVLVGSVAGLWIAAEQGAGYHVAKAGLETLIRYYAVKWGKLGIRVNGVSPSAFIKNESKKYHESNPQVSARMAKLTPLNRMGTSADSAAAIRFLAGPQASFITGQNLIVDGGLTLQLQTALG
ncbi:MAG: hypothetical protein RLZZ129_2247 [Verrucomicrobiota bacterium]|jgi:NAD(P)-dependent dehydrogenase (short-subunit alcohol dehydrogenase family)